MLLLLGELSPLSQAFNAFCDHSLLPAAFDSLMLLVGTVGCSE